MPRLTIHEASKTDAGIVRREAIIRVFEQQALLRNVPFMNIRGDTYTYNVEDQLPDVGYRGYNEKLQETVGTTRTEVELLKIMGSKVAIDKRIEYNRGGQRAMQERLVVTALARFAEAQLINGDSTADPKSIDGLKTRLTGGLALPANLGAPAANSPLSIGALMKAKDDVLNATAIVMGPDTARLLSQAAQQGICGSIQIEKDAAGFRTMIFDGLPVWIVDSDHRGQRIIDFNEVGPAGGAATATSVYVVSTGPTAWTALQSGGIMIDDLGRIPGDSSFVTEIDWQIGNVLHHQRAARRIWGITNAPVTV